MEPKQFDIGHKNYLTYQEYVSFALANFRTPRDKKDIGDKILYEDATFKTNFYDHKEIFEFLSLKGDFIDFVSLKKALKKIDINFNDHEIQQLIDFYSSNGKISYNSFKKTFDS
ncbi:hypothetical protein NGRA_2388 [Nosema granulosis]|uniref:Uncharacterized protein n=1 Tax=Nosema granulosis TaxID=83296 RepID=A0A9P6GZZ3_9MICR|nr:hypothetical protein NGRA_2388 [Nosema granulosis]